MLGLFIRVISPFLLFLGLVTLYAYATGQNFYDLIDALINLIHIAIRFIAEVFNRG